MLRAFCHTLYNIFMAKGPENKSKILIHFVDFCGLIVEYFNLFCLVQIVQIFVTNYFAITARNILQNIL